jgi:hypothetical protein
MAYRGDRVGGGRSAGELAGSEISPAGFSSPSVGMTGGAEGTHCHPLGARLGTGSGRRSDFSGWVLKRFENWFFSEIS